MSTVAISTPRPLPRSGLMLRVVATGVGIVAAISVAAARADTLASVVPVGSFPLTPFGGSEPTLIAHIGSIEVDLQAANESSLRRVPCIGAAVGNACFIPASR